MTEPVAKPSDSDSQNDRVLHSFPSIYLATVSIIQGVALGILAYQIAGILRNDRPLPQGVPIWAVECLAIVSFGGIVLVSYGYAWLMSTLRWPPRIQDTLLPYLVGVSEISAMFCLDRPACWWLCNFLFCVFGALTFLNTICYCKPASFDNFREDLRQEAHRLTKRVLWINLALSVAGALLCLITGILWLPIKDFSDLAIWTILLVYGALMVGSVVVGELHQRRLVGLRDSSGAGGKPVDTRPAPGPQ